MKIGVNTNTYHGYSLEEALNGIAAAGFKFVELTAVAGWTEHVNSNMTDEEIHDVNEMVSKRGLSTFGLSGHCNIMDDAGLQSFMDNLKLAKKLGCQYVVTSAGEAHGGEDVEDDAVLINNLREIGEVCSNSGLICVIETHGGVYNTGKQMNDLVRKVGSPNVGVNYDTANVIFYGKVNPEEEIVESFPGLKFVHLKDKDGKQDEWNFPAIGKGTVNFGKIFELLDKHGFDGPASIEIEFTPDGPGSLLAADQAVKDSFDYLRSLGKV